MGREGCRRGRGASRERPDPGMLCHALFDDAPDGIFVADPKGRLIAVNSRAAGLTGWSKTELLGRTLDDLLPPADPAGGSVSEKEGRLTRRDGSHVPIESRRRVLPDGTILVTVVDMTERRRETAKVLESDENLRSLMETAKGFAIYRLAVARDDPSLGRVLLLSPSFTEVTGIEDGNDFGAWFRDIHPEDLARVVEAHRRSIETGTGFDQILRGYHRGRREWIWLRVISQPVRNTVGVVTHFNGLLIDLTEQKRAEEALQESEAKFRQIAESINDVFWLFDWQQQRVLYASPAYETVWGRSREALYAHFEEWTESVHPEDRSRAEQSLGRVMESGGGEPREYRIVRPDGTVRWISDVGYAVRDPDGKVLRIAGIAEDITESRLAEAALVEKSQFIDSLLRAVPVAVFYKDRQGRYLGCNDTFTEIMGVTSEEIRGRTVHELWPSELADTYHQMDLELMRTREHQVYEFRVKDKEGTIRPVIYAKDVFLDKQGEVAGLVGAFLDITDRKQMEERLRESEARLTKTTENAPGMIYQFLLRPDGTSCFPYASAWCREMFGIPPETLADNASPLLDCILPEDRLGFEASVARSAETMGLWRWEGRLRATNGDVVWHQGISKPERQADGSILWSGIFFDITERKDSEIERERLQAQLMQAQKMESVGRLAGGVAHDFNNMLSAILGHAELALMDGQLSKPVCASLTEIRESVYRSADLVRQLLAFARKQTVAPKVLDLNDTVSGMLKMLQRLIGEDIDIAWIPGAGLGSVRIDPSQIDQMLANLCVNARDAITGVGTITIETESCVLDETYCAMHPGARSGEYVSLVVSDDGCGMDKEVIDHLFEPFFTTKEAGKGTGLGLATVYGIVKQNNGFINVYSEPGKGSTFRIYLPRVAGKPTGPASEVLTEPPRGHGETLLLVEDDAVILKVGRGILERLGYTVLTAGTPDEALRQTEAHAGEIRLLITDVVMPEMNGRDLARSIRDIVPVIKCLYTSGYTSDVIAHHGVLDEDVLFLQKPFSAVDLACRVREALKQE